MKIGITCYPTYGGSGVVATELGKALARRGHEIHFVSYALPFRLQAYDERIFFHEVEVMAYPLLEHPPYAISLAAKMSEVAEDVGLDLLHVHYAIPHAVSALLAKEVVGAGGPKVITTLHGTDITLVGNDRSLYPITRFTLLTSDGITCVSDYLIRKTREIFALERDLEMIPNFVDTDRFTGAAGAAIRARFAPQGERILMHLSNFRPVKRAADVVRIFERVRRQVPAKLLLVGDGLDRPMALHLAKEMGLLGDVLFLGKQEDVESLLGAADLFLLPSEQEAFGLAALEAMSCGVPVIATTVGGIPEVVSQGESGLLYEIGDVAAMAEGALKLLGDEARMGAFRAAARRRAVERFDARLIVPLYEAYYQEILNG